MCHDSETYTDKLIKIIINEDISEIAKSTKEWGGADVVITRTINGKIENWLINQPIVISMQRFQPQRRIIVTEYSRELSWLFEQFKKIYADKLDYVSKYDFYGYIAQSIIDILATEQKQLKELMLYVVMKAKEYFENDDSN